MRRRSVIMTGVLLPAVAACGAEDRDDHPPQWTVDWVSDSPEAELTAVVATARDEGWAVGMDAGGAVIVLRRQRRNWRPADLPVELMPSKGADLTAAVLAASGPDNVWLFARIGAEKAEDRTRRHAIRWDGQRWQPMPGDFGVRDVAVLAPDDVWALGTTTTDTGVAYHWDGTSWTGTRLPMDYPDRLSASGPDDVWASGSNDVRPATVHFDGTRWTDVPVPNRFPQAQIVDIVAVSPTEAWAVGTDLDVTAFALRWGGSAWTEVPDAIPDGGKLSHRQALYLTSDGAGGFVFAARDGGRHQYTADGTLRTIANPRPVAGRSPDKVSDVDRKQIFQPYDVTLVPGTRDIWAVGAVGLGRFYQDAQFSRGVVASYTAS